MGLSYEFLVTSEVHLIAPHTGLVGGRPEQFSPDVRKKLKLKKTKKSIFLCVMENFAKLLNNYQKCMHNADWSLKIFSRQKN